MAKNKKKIDIDNLPNMMVGDFYQMVVIVGYLSTEPSIQKDVFNKNSRGEDTWYCSFTLTTLTTSQTYVNVNCFLNGDKAHEFVKSFKRFDQLVLFGENISSSTEGILPYSVNRVKVNSWVAFKNYYGDMPTMSDEEMVFVRRCLKVYRQQAPIPTEEEIHKMKAVLNQWHKTNWSFK